MLLLIGVVSVLLSTTYASATQEHEVRYAGYGASMSTTATTTETITYTNKDSTLTETVKGVPKYVQVSDLPNSCGAIAGSIVIGFYDKYFENLIPNYKTYVSSGAYKGRDSVYIPQLMRELYTLMRTNVDDVGVNEPDCKNGLQAYVNEKGLSISYTNVKFINRINETACTNAIANNHPVLLFCSKLDLYNISVSENEDVLVRTVVEGGHICVAYGVYIVKYYNESSVFRTDKYLLVSTGLGLMTTGYLKLDATDWCNSAYEITIS